MDKRNTMNLLLLGAVSLPVGALALPYAVFFVPPKCVILAAQEELPN